MELRKQLQELEPLMREGLTPENLERIEKIKASITTDAERAELEAFVERHLLETEEEVGGLCNNIIIGSPLSTLDSVFDYTRPCTEPCRGFLVVIPPIAAF